MEWKVRKVENPFNCHCNRQDFMVPDNKKKEIHESRVFIVELLTGNNNYKVWKFREQRILDEHECWNNCIDITV